MLLSQIDFSSFIKTAHDKSVIAIDYETTGLNPYNGDKAFILGCCIDGITNSVLLNTSSIQQLKELYGVKTRRYLAHNAKFEMHFTWCQYGLEIEGEVWDTEVFARLCRNNYISYSLQNCAKRIGDTKYQPALDWLKKKGNKDNYHLMPVDLVVPYVEQDAYLSYKLYQDQYTTLKEWQLSSTPCKDLIHLEMKTTKNLFRMERDGFQIDDDYCRRAKEYEDKRALEYRNYLNKEFGEEFIDSSKFLTPHFSARNIPFGKTEKGNPSFDTESLKQSKSHPVVAAILGLRESEKRSNTYWSNLLDLQINSVIHPNIRQSGTTSGRFSANNPNIQNWPDGDREEAKGHDSTYPIRRAIITSHERILVSMDYAQMELRLIADEAQELKMIEDIENNVDFHKKTADIAGVPRNIAKNARFAKLYGAGPAKIAQTLGVEEYTAKLVCEAIDKESPRIKKYSYDLIRDAKNAGWISNWIGRRYFFDRDYEYKAPNLKIQGGCSDILRLAIDECYKIIDAQSKYNALILLPIHDELVFDIDKRELHLIPLFKEAMINSHRSRIRLRMDVGVAYGPNLHDLE